MFWIAIALLGTYALGRRLRLGVEAAAFAALTFALSGVPVLVARAGSLRIVLGEGAEPSSRIDFVSTGLLLVILALVLVFQRLTEPDEDDSPRAGWLSAAIGLGLAFCGTIAVLESRGLGRAAFHLIAPERLVRWPPVPVSSWIVFAGLALATVSLLCRSGELRARGPILLFGVPAFLVGMDLPGTGGIQMLVPGHAAALAGALAFALLAGEGLERTVSARPARIAAFLVLLPLVVAVRLQPTLVPPPISPSGAPEESELIGFDVLPDPAHPNERGEALFEGWLAPTSRIESARLVLVPIDAVDTGLHGSLKIPVELDVSTPNEPPPGVRAFRALVPLSELAVGHWSYRVEFLAADGVTPLVSRSVGMLTIPAPAGRDLFTLLLSVTVLLTLVLPWRPTVSARVVLACAAAQGIAFLCSSELF